jgi:CreA protein
MSRKLIICIGLSLLLFLTTSSYAGTPAVQIGEVVCIKRLIQGNDIIKIIRVQDPENPFVSIFFTTIDSGKLLAFADPSNTSVAARLTGIIPVDKDGKRVINKTPNMDIAHIRKSIGSKIMKIARFYDEKMDTLAYLIYTTKILDGSLKHSLSTVPLGKPLTP